MERILHDDWSISLGENRSDQPHKRLAATLTNLVYIQKLLKIPIYKKCKKNICKQKETRKLNFCAEH